MEYNERILVDQERRIKVLEKNEFDQRARITELAILVNDLEDAVEGIRSNES